MGTDNQGRDVLARVIYGFKISITFSLIVVLLSYIIGITIGASLGYFGGKLDLYGLRLIEIYSSMPFLFMIMMISSFKAHYFYFSFNDGNLIWMGWHLCIYKRRVL